MYRSSLEPAALVIPQVVVTFLFIVYIMNESHLSENLWVLMFCLYVLAYCFILHQLSVYDMYMYYNQGKERSPVRIKSILPSALWLCWYQCMTMGSACGFLDAAVDI